MATFTMTLDEVIARGYDLGLQNDPQRGYPIFDEAYRPVLNQRIIDRYRFQEIGQETVEMFRFALNRKLREVMPYYNQLYKTTLLQFNPLESTDWVDTLTTEMHHQANEIGSQTGTNTAETTSGARNVQNDFPQVALSGNGDYATTAADSTSKTDVTGTQAGESTNNSTGLDTGTVTRHMVGRSGAPSQLLMEFRQTLINVDLMVLAEVAPCFMMLWDDGDSFTPNFWGPYTANSFTFGFMGGYGSW